MLLGRARVALLRRRGLHNPRRIVYTACSCNALLDLGVVLGGGVGTMLAQVFVLDVEPERQPADSAAEDSERAKRRRERAVAPGLSGKKMQKKKNENNCLDNFIQIKLHKYVQTSYLIIFLE